MRKLFKWGKKYVPSLITLIVMNFILQFLYSYLPIFISFALEKLGDYSAKSTLPLWLIRFLESYGEATKVVLMTGIAMVALQAVRSCMRFTTNYLHGRITQNIARDMRLKLYNHIIDLPYSYHNNVDTGDLIQRCTSDIDTSSSFIASQFPNLIDIIGTVLIGAIQVYRINPTMMWVSIIVLPITGISSILYFKYSKKLIDNMENKEAELTTIIQENVNGVRVVKAFANEKYEFDKMEKANKEYASSSKKFINTMSLYWGASDFVVMAQYAAVIIVGIILAQKGTMSSPDIVACLLLMNMLVWPMRSLGRIVSNFGKSVVAAERIDQVLSNKSEFEINGQLTPEIKGNVQFKDVTFGFDDDDKEFLRGVTFSIKKGETVAVVGKTGSGKSTICNLLTRMLEYDKGQILIDGIDIKDIEKKHLRRNVKMVLQDPFLFSKTVYDNISIANPKASKERIYEVSKIASVYDEINKFNKGYSTLVGEKGTTLSGGQKQRLAIARVLVDEAPILVFDDSLSALDTKTDLEIRNALKEKNNDQTMIIITHRTTTAKEADKIVVLNDGKVEAVGTHEELTMVPGLYKDLWEIQGELEREFMKVLKGGDM